jgi:uncharacterized protein (UPF0264 family)
MTQLLVSVRSAAEAEAALRGGAALLDVKEPANGPLGRADDATLAEVVRAVAGRRPVSAALGELTRESGRNLPSAIRELAYVKWGPAGCAEGDPAWQRAFEGEVGRLRQVNPACRAVAVAYADWRWARAPHPETIRLWARRLGVRTILLDTWGKDGTTLLDWLSVSAVREWCRRCRDGGACVALAGSLGPDEIRALLPARPDWFAVRGAACRGRQRTATIDEGEVRRLVQLLAESFTPATPAG